MFHTDIFSPVPFKSGGRVNIRGKKNSIRGNSKSSVKKSNKNTVKIDFKPVIKVHLGDSGVKSASGEHKPGFSGFPFLGYNPHPPQGPPPPQVIPQKNNDLLNHQILTQYRRELNFLREERLNPPELLAPGASRPSFAHENDTQPTDVETPDDYERILSRAQQSINENGPTSSSSLFDNHTPEISVPSFEVDEGKNEVKPSSRIEAPQHAHDEQELEILNAQIQQNSKPKHPSGDPSRMTVQELSKILSSIVNKGQGPLRKLGVQPLRKMYFDNFGEFDKA